jgi:periplasmic copper chaperone A
MKRGVALLHRAGIALVMSVVLAAIARADDTNGVVRVAQGWIRALPLALPSAGYFTLENGTRADLVLVGAQSPACGHVSLHKSELTGGICRMRDAPEVDVPALGMLVFAPLNYHLMCEHARPVLKPGAVVPMTLIFKGGRSVIANFAVRNAAGR